MYMVINDKTAYIRKKFHDKFLLVDVIVAEQLFINKRATYY